MSCGPNETNWSCKNATTRCQQIIPRHHLCIERQTRCVSVLCVWYSWVRAAAPVVSLLRCIVGGGTSSQMCFLCNNSRDSPKKKKIKKKITELVDCSGFLQSDTWDLLDQNCLESARESFCITQPCKICNIFHHVLNLLWSLMSFVTKALKKINLGQDLVLVGWSFHLTTG